MEKSSPSVDSFVRKPLSTIILVHNHPSGDPTPSPDDMELTRRLVAAGVLMGIDVVDHIILGDVRYCSFKVMGQL